MTLFDARPPRWRDVPAEPAVSPGVWVAALAVGGVVRWRRWPTVRAVTCTAAGGAELGWLFSGAQPPAWLGLVVCLAIAWHVVATLAYYRRRRGI